MKNKGGVDASVVNKALRNLANLQESAASSELFDAAWGPDLWTRITGGALVFVPTSIKTQVQDHCKFLIWWLSTQCALAVETKPSLSFNAIANANPNYTQEHKEMARALVNACSDLYDPRAMRGGVGAVSSHESDLRILQKYFTVPGINKERSDLFVRAEGYRSFRGRNLYRTTSLWVLQKIDPVTDGVEIAYDILTEHAKATAFDVLIRDPRNSHPAREKTAATPDHASSAGVVLQSTHIVSSFNFQHMSTEIFGVFSSSIAQRHQMLGRILRLGQERPTVVYKKLVPMNTILSVLDERHERGDAVQSTFESRAARA
jgi:hypothetical protein